ncbi:hypothetical protein YC2023_100532 [Brassica napus]
MERSQCDRHTKGALLGSSQSMDICFSLHVKIWDVYNSGKCMRIYMGHGKAVRDICFSNDGTKFLTGGYDKNIKYWDTETGHRLSRQEGSLCG